MAILRKKSLLVLALSLIPGLSHLYLGLKKKAIVLLIIDLGLVVGFVFSETYLMKVILINIYLFTSIPAGLETYQRARNKESKINTDSKWYTVVLLLTTGFSALPLLWQNRHLSRRFKVGWTIAVPVLAIVFFGALVQYWDKMEQILRKII